MHVLHLHKVANDLDVRGTNNLMDARGLHWRHKGVGVSVVHVWFRITVEKLTLNRKTYIIPKIELNINVGLRPGLNTHNLYIFAHLSQESHLWPGISIRSDVCRVCATSSDHDFTTIVCIFLKSYPLR
jgi:hypothetical protein